MNKPRILITGVAGFIGSNLADRLIKEGFSVVGVDNLSYGVAEQVPFGVEFYRQDIRSPQFCDLVQKNDVIFHLAAKNCINDCQKDPLETASINVLGTVNVFEAARKKQAAKVIYAESSALYEGSVVLPTPESEVCPNSFYAVSKVCSMYFAEAYRRYYNLHSTALRYFCVYGPRQDYRRTIPPVMSAFIINLLNGRAPTIYGSGSKMRDFVYIDDINEFHLHCISDSRTNDRVFNLGSGVNHSINDIYTAIESLLKTGLTPEYKDDLPGEAESTLADITAANSLGWTPKINLEEGLRRSIEYIRKHVPIK